MKRSLFALITGAALASSAFLVIGNSSAEAGEPAIAERWVNANLVQIRVDGNWKDVHLMPLADHLCAGKNPHYRQYCD